MKCTHTFLTHSLSSSMCSRRSHWNPPAVPSLLGVADRLAAFRSAVCSPSGRAAGRSLERRGGRCFTPVGGYSLHHKRPGQEGEAEDQPTCVTWSSFRISSSLIECSLSLWRSDERAGVNFLPSAAVQVPRHGVRRAGALSRPKNTF